MKRAALVVALALLVSPVAPAGAADTWSDPSLLSKYLPTETDSTIANASSENQAYFYHIMYWDHPSRVAAINDNPGDDAYEHEAHLYTEDCWKDAPWGDYRSTNPYEEWDSNLPNPYLDTSYGEGDDPGANRGGGSWDSGGHMQTGVYYYHLSWTKPGSMCPSGVPYKIQGTDSHTGFNVYCDSSSRSWCVYGDDGAQRDNIPFTSGRRTGYEYPSAFYQELVNSSFEDATMAGWTLASADPVIPAIWANYFLPTQALEWNRFIEFNCRGGRAGCRIYQDVQSSIVAREDLWTHEVGLRCRASTTCHVQLALEAWGGVYTLERNIIADVAIPNDGKWHIHGFRQANYVANHTRMRFSVISLHSTNTLQVDFATLNESDMY